MPMSNYPNGFANGVNIRGLPILSAYGGDVFWVDSGAGSDGYKGTYDRPFATIDYAVGKCAANNGDLILVKPGHSETITAAAGIALDIAGISIIGLGSGSDRPTINFTIDTGADLDIDAANITIENVYFDLTGVDGVVAAIDVNAADFMLRGCEILMADGTGQAVVAVLGATAAARMKIHGTIIRAPNTGADCAIRITGTADGNEVIGCHIYGDFADAAIHNPTGNVATNVRIENNYLQNTQTGDHAIEFVSAVTGIIRNNFLVTDAIATAVDQGSCFAADNWYFDSSDTDAAATRFPATPTTGGQIALGTSDAATTDSVSGKLGTDTELADRSLYDILNGGGPAAAASAAAPANDISLYAVLRKVFDQQLGTGTDASTNSVLGTRVTKTGAVVSAADDLFDVTGQVLVTLMYGVVTTLVAGGTAPELLVNVKDGSNTPISASTVITGDAADTIYWVMGDPNVTFGGGDAPTVGFAGNGSASGRGFIIDNVTIESTPGGTLAATAGAITWTLFYIPLENSAAVAAAA